MEFTFIKSFNGTHQLTRVKMKKDSESIGFLFVSGTTNAKGDEGQASPRAWSCQIQYIDM